MQLATNAYKIKEYKIEQFLTTDLAVWYILRNAMNSILEAGKILCFQVI